MNIKEVEQQTGLARANIRFYEEKGLLNPPRRDNGYRCYGKDDLETLRRIHLLRMLDVSLEDIRALQTGEKRLMETMRQQEAKWEQRKSQAEVAGAICRAIREDGVSYDALDAGKYMEKRLPAPKLPEEANAYPFCPGRRFFARGTDYLLALLLWRLVLSVGFHANQALWTGLLPGVADLLALLGLTLLLEPACLHFLGTTPGKWLMGLRIRDVAGQKLSWRTAWQRTVMVLGRGCGFFLPVYRLIRVWKSWHACLDGEMSSWDWERDVQYTWEDRRRWRGWALGGVMAALLWVMIFFLPGCAALPPCRGQLTVAQFARNYNFYLDFYGQRELPRLGIDGQYGHRAQGDAFAVQAEGEIFSPKWRYTLDEEGWVREVSFHFHRENAQTGVGGVEDTLYAAALALMCAQPQVTPLSGAPGKIINTLDKDSDMIRQMMFGTPELDETLFGVRARCAFVQRGYVGLDHGAWLVMDKGQGNVLTLDYFLTLETPEGEREGKIE